MFEMLMSIATIIFSIFIGFFLFKNVLGRYLKRNDLRINLTKKREKGRYQIFLLWFVLVWANYGAFVNFDNIVINILLPLAWIAGLIMIAYMEFSPEYILGDSIYTSTGGYKLKFVDTYEIESDSRMILHMRTANKMEVWAYKTETYDVVINFKPSDMSKIETVLRNKQYQ